MNFRNFEYISSKDNKLIKSVRKLVSSSRERKITGLFVLEGLRLCADAAINGYSIETVIVSEKIVDSDRLQSIISASKKCINVPDSLFEYICDTVNPQGVMCLVKMPPVKQIGEFQGGKYIILDNLSDPSNLGAIARTAEAFGICGILVSSDGCDVFSPKAQRAAMGALLRLPVIVSNDLSFDIKTLKDKGVVVLASVVNNADANVNEVDFSNSCAIVVGNEANGVTKEIISLCDKTVTIPMLGKAESLNAAAAAAVLMWEMVRKENS